jgi:organic hydroperoxide reductase OsmC/OhrA
MASPADNDAAGRIAKAIGRLEDAVAHKPGFGHSSSRSTTTLEDGLRCVTSEGDHRIETDLTAALGGDGSGPTPSALLRAALGSCLAMGYRLRAARHGVPVAAIRVEVETDSAIGGMLDPGSAFPPGFLEVRYCVEIDSRAPAGQVEALIDEGDRLSPVLDALTRANRVARLAASPSPGGPG